MSERKYLTKEQIITLQESVGFLDNYITPDNEVHHVGPNVNTEDMKETLLLRELGEINLRRIQIIKQLCQKEK